MSPPSSPRMAGHDYKTDDSLWNNQAHLPSIYSAFKQSSPGGSPYTSSAYQFGPTANDSAIGIASVTPAASINERTTSSRDRPSDKQPHHMSGMTSQSRAQSPGHHAGQSPEDVSRSDGEEDEEDDDDDESPDQSGKGDKPPMTAAEIRNQKRKMKRFRYVFMQARQSLRAGADRHTLMQRIESDCHARFQASVHAKYKCGSRTGEPPQCLLSDRREDLQPQQTGETEAANDGGPRPYDAFESSAGELRNRPDDEQQCLRSVRWRWCSNSARERICGRSATWSDAILDVGHLPAARRPQLHQSWRRWLCAGVAGFHASTVGHGHAFSNIHERRNVWLLSTWPARQSTRSRLPDQQLRAYIPDAIPARLWTHP